MKIEPHEKIYNKSSRTGFDRYKKITHKKGVHNGYTVSI